MTAIALPTRLALTEAQEVLAETRARLSQDGPIVCDAAAVERLSAVAAQTLAAIAAHTSAKPGFALINPSPAFTAAITRLGLETLFDADNGLADLAAAATAGGEAETEDADAGEPSP